MEINKPIATFLIIIITLLMFFFLVVPKYKEFKSFQLTLAQKNAEFNGKYEYFANVSEIYHNIEDRRDDFDKLDDALPDNPNLGKLAYYFESESKENGLLLKNLSLSKLSSNQDNVPGQIIFSLDIFGDYSSLLNFIISLEKSAKIFEFEGISFKSPEGESSSVSGKKIQNNGLFDFTLQVKTNSY